jgi:hypothetical protein
MDVSRDYFLCDQCSNKNFIRIYSFSIHFRRVNFSDDLIGDEVINVIYQCTHCKKTFSKHQIQKSLKGMIDERVKSLALPKK